jgi:hypothetical protein
VFILSSSSMFDLGVQRQLGRVPELEAVGCDSPLDRAATCIRKLRPDVVVLDIDRWPGELPAELIALGDPDSGIRVIGLSLRNNTFRCYGKVTRRIRQFADLVEAVG